MLIAPPNGVRRRDVDVASEILQVAITTFRMTSYGS